MVSHLEQAKRLGPRRPDASGTGGDTGRSPGTMNARTVEWHLHDAFIKLGFSPGKVLRDALLAHRLAD